MSVLQPSGVPANSMVYIWWFPGSPVRVHLALDVVRRMREQLRLAAGNAAEEGLLFGDATAGTTEVLDFQCTAGPVPEAIHALAVKNSKRLLVGYYRTEAGDLRLNQSDLSHARTSFPQPYQVFLLIQPTGYGPPNASFFFHDNTGKMAEFSLMEFPFDPSLLAGEERGRVERSQEAAARRSAALESATAVRRPRGALGHVFLAVTVMFALLILGAGISVGSRAFPKWWSRIPTVRLEPARLEPARPEPAAAPPSPLSALSVGLHARRENGSVEITWKRDSPVIAAAISGVLSIQDGRNKPSRNIPLDATQVRNSSVLYSPHSNHVSIQLSITTPVSTVIESIMLLQPNDVPPKILALPNDTPPKLYTLPEPKSSDPRRRKPFTPPTAAAPPKPGLPLLPPEPSLGADRDSIPILIAPAIPLVSERIPVPPPNVSGTPPKAAPASVRPLDYHPPEPLHRVVPRLHSQLLTMLPRLGTVEVRLAIDKSGRVTQAEAIPQPGVDNLVLGQIVSAARSWTFTPARRGDEPVASEFVLQFHFAR